jgi:CubicO group peptidase (beta-lactamase class C family)
MLKKTLLIFIAAILTGCATNSLSEKSSKDITQSYRKLVDDGYYPGASILLIQDGDILLKDSYGVANISTKVAFTEDQLCWLASTGKMFTAALMASLVSDGLISYDDPISKYYPEFAHIKLANGQKPKQAVLIRHALSHTTGIPSGNWLKSHKDSTRENPGKYNNYWQPQTPQDFINACLQIGLVAEPGTKMMYGTPIDLVACVAEKVTGKKFTQLMKERILEPLALSKTTVIPTDEQLKQIAPLYTSSVKHQFSHNPLSEYVANRQRTRFTTAGGCTFSTLVDVARLLQLHLNKGVHNGKRLISEQALNELYKIQHGTKQRYGLAFMIRQEEDGNIFYHPGHSGPVGWIDFERRLVGVMLMQSNTKGRDDLHKKVIQKINQHVNRIE